VARVREIRDLILASSSGSNSTNATAAIQQQLIPDVVAPQDGTFPLTSVHNAGFGRPSSEAGADQQQQLQSPVRLKGTGWSPQKAGLVEGPSIPKKVNLNLSPYRDLSPKKEKFRKTTGPVLLALNKQTEPDDPSYFFWLYGFIQFKMQEPEEVVMRKAMRQVDRLVEKLHKLDAKGCLLFDIIATRKHIASYVPHKLGRAIYKYVEDNYFSEITTTFVGLTDNTARRVARDIFCKNKELSRHKCGFDIVDNVHMFVIYPPIDSRNHNVFSYALEQAKGSPKRKHNLIRSQYE
jgi:hypothetical protein